MFKVGFGLKFVDSNVGAFLKKLTAQAESGDKQYFLITPNPEIMLKAAASVEFYETLKAADYLLPDAFGLTWSLWWLESDFAKDSAFWRYLLLYPSLLYYWLFVRSEIEMNRITGVDLLKKFLIHYPEEPVFLLGASPGVAEAVVKEFPYSNVVGVYAGSPAKEEAAEIIEKINVSKAKWLFVAYGAPRQEFWIRDYLPKLQSVRVAVGVGGAFDFLSGNIKRAPFMIRRLGLEWLFRLILQPWRWKRIYNAVIRYPLWVVKQV